MPLSWQDKQRLIRDQTDKSGLCQTLTAGESARSLPKPRSPPEPAETARSEPDIGHYFKRRPKAPVMANAAETACTDVGRRPALGQRVACKRLAMELMACGRWTYKDSLDTMRSLAPSLEVNKHGSHDERHHQRQLQRQRPCQACKAQGRHSRLWSHGSATCPQCKPPAKPEKSY